MSVEKYVRFAAPYRSKTFNDTHNFMLGANGVLAGGEVTTSGSTVTIQPVVFVQQGLVVNATSPISTALPISGLTAPYYVGLSTSSAVQNLAENLTPVFVKRPVEAQTNITLIAEWDGQEWRALPHLDSEGILQDNRDRAVAAGNFGIGAGFSSTQTLSTITVAPGTLIAKDGTYVTKQLSAILNKVAVPSFGAGRVDNVVFRKPQDDPNRIGTVQLVVGPSYDQTLSTAVGTVATIEGTAPSYVKQLIKPSTGEVVLLYMLGTDIRMAVMAADLSTVTLSATTIATAVDSFDACMNAGETLDFVYGRTTNLYYKRVSMAGADLFIETAILTGTNTLATPKIVSVGNVTNSALHVVVAKNTSGSTYELGYIQLNNSNTVVTPYVMWVDLSSTLANPYLEKDDEDMELYLGFENQTTGRAYYRRYDAGTATSTTPPTLLESPVELQNDTYDIQGALSAPATGAINVVIKRTANKEVFVFWKHFMGAGQYAVAIWNSSYIDTFGHKALIIRDEIVSSFGVDLDGMNRAYFTTVLDADPSHFSKYAVDLSEAAVILGPDTVVSAAAPYSLVSVLFHTKGDLAHFVADNNGAQFVPSTAYKKVSLRDQQLTVADLYLANYRVEDSTLAVSGLAMEESTVFKRLYEFFNCFAGSAGAVTWGKVASNTLVFNAPITMSFFNRVSTYTIPSNSPLGVLVPANSVCYVSLPDTDANATLTLQVSAFGDGILDRFGRNDFPLFWNIGGNLYMRFAPYKLDPGETGYLGSAVSQEMLNWLGATSEVPDAANHAYGSFNYITAATSHENAIGALDAAIAGTPNGAVLVKAYDDASTTLPTGTVTIDTVAISAGDLVVFTNLSSGNNEVYKAVGTGLSITSWTAQAAFNNSASPSVGSMLYVQQGDVYLGSYYSFNGTDWYPVSGTKSSFALGDAQSLVTIASFPISKVENANMEYSISRNGTKRTGVFCVTHNGTDVEYEDNGAMGIGDTGIDLSATISGSNLLIQYSSTSTGFTGTLKRSFKTWI